MSVVHVGNPPKEWDGWESHLVHFHNFASLPSGKGECVMSPEFRGFGHEWRVLIFPGGHSKAKAGNISFYIHHCSRSDFSVQFHFSIKNKSGGAVAERSLSPHKFVGGKSSGWHDFSDHDVITNDDVLNNGSLTVEVRIKPVEGDLCRNFIPKNPFVRNMLLLFLDEETADMSFEVESRPLIDASKDTSPTPGEVFHAHKLVLRTCTKGSILGSLCDDCDGSTPVPITDVAPKVFRLLLRYVYGGDISAGEWKDHSKDLLEASDKYGLTNLKIEAEAWYVKLLKIYVGDVVETVAYAEKMNCFLLKEAAIDFIVTNANEVLASGTLMNIPESKDIIREILWSVATMSKQEQHKIDSKDLHQLSMNDLRARLALLEEALITRLKGANLEDN
jgi:uncharacterized small protein (DUF1192 family)